MRFIIGIILGVIVGSCSQDDRLIKYDQLIDSCEKIRIYAYSKNDLILKKEVSGSDLAILKEILKRNVKPETQKKFVAKTMVELISEKKQIGALLVSESSVNFQNRNFGFGFQLTYGIGTYLDGL